MNEKLKTLGRVLSKKEQRNISGGDDEEVIWCKTPCTCADGTSIMCDCGFEIKCIQKKCSDGHGICVA
jgi:hypothetical protein